MFRGFVVSVSRFRCCTAWRCAPYVHVTEHRSVREPQPSGRKCPELFDKLGSSYKESTPAVLEHIARPKPGLTGRRSFMARGRSSKSISSKGIRALERPCLTTAHDDCSRCGHPDSERDQFASWRHLPLLPRSSSRQVGNSLTRRGQSLIRPRGVAVGSSTVEDWDCPSSARWGASVLQLVTVCSMALAFPVLLIVLRRSLGRPLRHEILFGSGRLQASEVN